MLFCERKQLPKNLMSTVSRNKHVFRMYFRENNSDKMVSFLFFFVCFFCFFFNLVISKVQVNVTRLSHHRDMEQVELK